MDPEVLALRLFDMTILSDRLSGMLFQFTGVTSLRSLDGSCIGYLLDTPDGHLIG